jgi:thiamine-phosphate diphosphorylase
MRFDLYVLTDPALTRDRPLLPIVAAALAAGATAVQLRDKHASPRDLLPLGAEMRRMAHRHQAAFIVNDRVDLALVLEADGAHVGPEDLPPLEARRLLPRPRLLGVSARTPQAALSAERAGADYLGAGPVFPTSTKPDAGPALGLEGLSAIVKAVSIPVVGIGGIHAANAASVIEAGAAGIAVIAAVMAAEDPETAVRDLLASIDEPLRRRRIGEEREESGRARE